MFRYYSSYVCGAGRKSSSLSGQDCADCGSGVVGCCDGAAYYDVGGSGGEGFGWGYGTGLISGGRVWGADAGGYQEKVFAELCAELFGFAGGSYYAPASVGLSDGGEAQYLI